MYNRSHGQSERKSERNWPLDQESFSPCPAGGPHMPSTITKFTESFVEEIALGWLADLGWRVASGPSLLDDSSTIKRSSYEEVVLELALRNALETLNPELPLEAIEEAIRKLTRSQGSTTAARNRSFHRMVVDGVTVEYRDDGGRIRGGQVQVINFDKPDDNDWLAVYQFTVIENQNRRRPDIVLFLNGLTNGDHRTQESSGGGCHGLDCLAATPNLQG